MKTVLHEVEFARMPLPRIPVVTHPPAGRRCDIVALLREASHAARLIVRNKPVEVTETVDTVHHIINADPDKIRWILMGLVSNAARKTARGRIALILCRDDDEIRLTVADTGRGVKQKQVNAEQVSSIQAVDKKNHATGGWELVVAKVLVKQLHGNLSVASKPDAGTIAAVSLPAKRLS